MSVSAPLILQLAEASCFEIVLEVHPMLKYAHLHLSSLQDANVSMYNVHM